MRSLIILFLSLSPGLLAAGAKDVDSKVQKVTIFLNQAEVMRSASLGIGPETTQLVFGGLSSQLDANSIQVRGKGDFIILGTSFRNNYLTEENPSQKVQELKDLIAATEQKLASNSNQISALKAEEDLLKANKVIKGESQSLSVNELKTMADYFRSRLLAISDEVYGLQLKSNDLQKELQRLKNQLNEQNAQGQMVSGEVVVDISTAKSQTVTLELSYVVSGASWSPVYDLRARSGSESLELVYKAEVYQHTGETWANVKLALSTSNPSIGGSLPTVWPWYLDFFTPRAYQKSQPAERSEAPMMMGAGADMEMNESIADFTEVTESLTSINYEIDLPVTVPTGGKQVTVSIRKEDVAAEFVYQSTPKLSEKVYLMAKTKDWRSLDLLPGELNVFYEGGFVNKTYINPGSDTEEFNVSLGVDPAIQIKRSPVKDLTADQFIGNKRRIAYQYEVELGNNKPKAITVEVFDQLPITKNTDIEISQLDLAGAKLESKTGKLTWNVSLEPQARKTWKFGYEVKYPKDKQVSGL